jgi:hypothetical protein
MTSQLNQIAAQHHIAELHRQAALDRRTRPPGEPRPRTGILRFVGRLAAYGASSRTSSAAGRIEPIRATDTPA